MKVYIGPYPHWWNVARFQNWCLKKLHGTEYGWQVKEENYTRLDKVIDKTLDGWQFVLNKTVNKISQKRKEKIVIHNYDTWSMDHTLAMIILPMLKQLREDKHGAPFVDDKDVPKELRSTSAPKKENEWDTDDNHFKRWDWVLDEMIWAFEQKNAPDEGRSNYHDPYGPDEEVKRSYFGGKNEDGTEKKTFIVSENTARKMGKFNKTKYKEYMNRKQKAYMLFGKYYEALWD